MLIIKVFYCLSINYRLKKILKLTPYRDVKRLAAYKITGEFNVRDINGSHYLGKKVCPCNPQN